MDLKAAECVHRTIVQYWLVYQLDNKYITLFFDLGANVAVNSIIGLPPLRQWGGNLDFGNDTFINPNINNKFPLDYEPTE